MKRRLSVTNLSSENKLLTFQLNAPGWRKIAAFVHISSLSHLWQLEHSAKTLQVFWSSSWQKITFSSWRILSNSDLSLSKSLLHCNKLFVLVGNGFTHKLGVRLGTAFSINTDWTYWCFHKSSISSCYKIKLRNLFGHNTDYLMSCPTSILLLYALQQLKLNLRS